MYSTIPTKVIDGRPGLVYRELQQVESEHGQLRFQIGRTYDEKRPGPEGEVYQRIFELRSFGATLQEAISRLGKS